MIRLKRAYDEPGALDGRRILVERLWPRGLSKEKAALDLWLKEMAPSPQLRQWFNHQETRWPEFRRRYREELRRRPEELHRLRKLVAEGPVTFVFGSHDEEHNAAVVLKEAVEGGLATEDPPAGAGEQSEDPPAHSDASGTVSW